MTYRGYSLLALLSALLVLAALGLAGAGLALADHPELIRAAGVCGTCSVALAVLSVIDAWT